MRDGILWRHERPNLRRNIRRLLRACCGLRAFLRKGPLNVAHDRNHFAMETIVISLIALACLVYLVVAVLRPEKF